MEPGAVDAGYMDKLQNGILGATAALVGVTTAFSPVRANTADIEVPAYGLEQEAGEPYVCEGEFTAGIGPEVPFRYEEGVVFEDGEEMNILRLTTPDGVVRYLDTEDEENLDLDADSYRERTAELLVVEKNGQTYRINIDPGDNPMPEGEDLPDIVGNVNAEMHQALYNGYMETLWTEARATEGICKPKRE